MNPHQLISRVDPRAARPAVIVMAKAPRAGYAKTRLAPMVVGEDAASLSAAFIQDSIATARAVASNVVIAYAPPRGRATIETLVPNENLLWIEQQGGNLGRRLSNAVRRAAEMGFSPLIVTGTDSPTLPRESLRAAADALARSAADVALGATDDGGYYFIALREPHDEVFERVAWSTARVFDQTVANVRRMNLRLHEAATWYDVDTPDDLHRLRSEMLADASMRERAPATYAWLRARESILSEG